MSTSSNQGIKEALRDILDDLTPVQWLELLDFARFLRQQTLDHPASLEERTEGVAAPDQGIPLNLSPATNMADLTGIVSLGGDAVADTKALYDGDDCT